MPRKTKANLSRAQNISRGSGKRYRPSIEEVPDKDMPNSPSCDFGTHQTHLEQLAEVAGIDQELLEITGHFVFLQEDELPEWGPEDVDTEDEPDSEEAPETDIQEESALQKFAETLQRAHDSAAAAEREREKGKKRPKRELEKKGYLSIKKWLLQGQKPKEVAPINVECVFSGDETADEEPQIGNLDPPDDLFAEQDMGTPEDLHESNSEPEDSSTCPIHAVPEAELDAREQVEQLLQGLREGRKPHDNSQHTATDHVLDQMHYRNLPTLRRACAKLTMKSKDKKLNVFFRARITAMVGTLNLYLDPELSYTWRESSLVVAKSQNCGVNHARNIRTWIHQFLSCGKFPLHRYGRSRGSILNDEDFCQAIQLHLQGIAKDGYIRAQDIVDYVATPEMQQMLADSSTKKRSISLRTAQRWLHRMGWRCGRKKNGMYIDGHEREDVVWYREGFIERWKTYEKRMFTHDNEGNTDNVLNGFPVPAGQAFRLVLVTHDESTFYQNDRRKTKWTHSGDKATPERKGEGPSLMVSDFLTTEWGRLVDGTDEARIIFKAGKNRDGYFTADDLIQQVDKAIDIFEGKSSGFATGLFLFDNAPSHQKRADDALSARKMPKGPNDGWTHRKGGARMRNGTLADGTSQDFYFADDHPTMPGWFKGMEIIIQERGLWPANGLLAQCEGFKCEPKKTDCCCRRLLFTQPDFTTQRSRLEEFVTSRGHICDFYPKYHCELNFIEQYWGASKLRYRATSQTSSIAEMEKNMLACLDDIPLLQIRRYANRAARFISAYAQGLSGAEAAWANRKYHGHRVLPGSIVAEIKQSVAA